MKFTMEQFDDYSPDSYGFFSLKNNHEKCRVRFLYESLNDVDGRSCHKVALKGGGFRYVDCLRTYDEPADTCPFCVSDVTDDRKLISRIWVPILKVDKDEMCLWERGKSFWQKQLYPLMVEKGQPFCGNVFTIERNGEPGDINTTYDITFEGFDDTVIDDFEEIPTADNVVLTKSYDEMTKFLRTRTFDDDTAQSGSDRRNSVAGDAPEFPTRSRRGVRPNTLGE